MPCDLHVHSIHSDGSLTPAELIAEAKKFGLTIALTDHNTVSGLPDFMEQAAGQGVTAVPGIEISSVSEGIELHVVGLFISPEHYETIENTMQEYHRLKEESNLALAEALSKGGYAIRYDEIKHRAKDTTPNRAHFALALVEAGYVSSVQEAFETLLGEDMGYYTPPRRLGTADAIRWLTSLHVLPVLAHPLLNLTAEELRRRLPDLQKAGLKAMEVQHCTYDDQTIATAKAIADEFELLYSGGSDFHGTPKPDVKLGVGKGNLDIPQEYYETLQNQAKLL